MARIIFTVEEVLQCIELNGWLRGKIEKVALDEVSGNTIAIRLDVGIGGLGEVKIPIEFVEYNDGVCLIRITAKGPKGMLIGGALKLISQEAIEIDKLDMRIDLNRLLGGKVQGIRIEDVRLNDGQFTIEVANER